MICATGRGKNGEQGLGLSNHKVHGSMMIETPKSGARGQKPRNPLGPELFTLGNEKNEAAGGYGTTFGRKILKISNHKQGAASNHGAKNQAIRIKTGGLP